MIQRLFCILASLMILLCASCKKDLLQWQRVQKLNSNTNATLNNIRFINANVCIIGGGNIWSKTEILRSSDGGYSWYEPAFPASGIGMLGFSISPAGNMYMCGADGTIIYSGDTGKSWHSGNISNKLFYVAASFPSVNKGFLVRTHLQLDGAITQVDSNLNIINEQSYKFGMNNIYMLSPETGYLLGYGTVMKTIDGGQTWNYQDATGDNFEALDIHGEELWMCGYNGSIYHTTNGGGHWDKVRNGNDVTIPKYRLLSILFKDSNNGWAVGEDGKVIRTDDGGQHWEEYDQFTTSALRCIVQCPNSDLLVAGDNGALYRVASR